jgi:hypothetical protein
MSVKSWLAGLGRRLLGDDIDTEGVEWIDLELVRELHLQGTIARDADEFLEAYIRVHREKYGRAPKPHSRKSP